MSNAEPLKNSLLENHIKRLQVNNAAIETRSYNDLIKKAICEVSFYYSICKDKTQSREMLDLLKITAENLKDFPTSNSVSICNLMYNRLGEPLSASLWSKSPITKTGRTGEVIKLFQDTLKYDRPFEKDFLNPKHKPFNL